MTAKLEKFSNLAALLREIEVAHVEIDDGGVQDARRTVVETLEKYHTSRYRFGEALAAYRAHFVGERGWMEAAQAIGAAMGRDERTVRNIIADYRPVADLPESVIAAAEAEGLDLAERKHVSLVEAINVELAGNGAFTPSEAREVLTKVLEMPVSGTPKVALDKAEKLRFSVRMKIRTALTNVPNDRKLVELVAALEEELHDVWASWSAPTDVSSFYDTTTLSGRPIKLLNEPRQALNYQDQGTGADILALAIALLPADVAAMMMMPVHDELVFEVPADLMERTEAVVADTMTRAANKVLGGQVPVEVKTVVGETWTKD